jgi:uncharacterized Fe-S cluster-containing MiaB family protein
MKILNFTCRYCKRRSKLVLEDIELTQDGAEVEGMCELCLEEYQADPAKFIASGHPET